MGWHLLMCGACFASGAVVAAARYCRFYLHMYDYTAWHKAKVQYIGLTGVARDGAICHKAKVQYIRMTGIARDGVMVLTML